MRLTDDLRNPVGLNWRTDGRLELTLAVNIALLVSKTSLVPTLIWKFFQQLLCSVFFK